MSFLRNVLFVLLFKVASFGQLAWGELPAPEPAEPPERGVTAERVESLQKEIDASAELDAELKKKTSEICRAALGELKRYSELTAQVAQCRKDTEVIEERVEQVKRRLDEITRTEPSAPSEMVLSDLEQAFSKFELHRAAQKKSQAAMEAEPALRAGRRKEIRARLTKIPGCLADNRKQAETLPADEHALITAARKAELTARRMVLEAEAPALECELTRYDAEDSADLVRLQRDLCAREMALADRQIQFLDERIKKARAAAAEQAVRRARDDAIAADPVLKSYAVRNRRLTEVARAITGKFDVADKDLKAAKEVHDQLQRQFEKTCKKVETVGLTNSVGALLRKQKAVLPDIGQRRASVNARRATIDQVQYELFEYDDERQILANPELQVQGILTKAGTDSTKDLDVLEAATREVLDRQCEYLDALIRSYSKYFDTLVELDLTEQQIIAVTEQYHQYINERVLWIRSGNLLSSELRLDQSDSRFVSAVRWSELRLQMWRDVTTDPVPYLLAGFIFLVLFVRNRRLRAILREIGDLAQRATCRSVIPTFRAIALTVLISLLWPATIGFVAWRVNCAAGESQLGKAIAQGLFCVVVVWFPLELLRQTCRPRGLAEAHFEWPCSAAQRLRQHLRWLVLLGLPLTFVTSAFFASDPTHGRDAVERICFMLLGLVWAVFLRGVLKPGGVLQEYIAYHHGGWIDRLKNVWYMLGVAAPMILTGLAFWGYYYTAQVLSWHLYATMCFVALLVLQRALLLRLILLRRRKLSMDQARERLAAVAQSGESNAAVSPAGIVTEETGVDLLGVHSIQTRRMLTMGTFAATLVGFWLIWVEVLPALSLLDQWPLWTTTTSVKVVEPEESSTSGAMPAVVAQSDPVVSERTVYQTNRVTFSNAALAVLVAFITFISARNVPGLLEMSVLQRLPLDASVRYAITTLVSYCIVLTGTVVACSNIGLRWSQIQWLATALTFGLAFGLQEIFANFVAGLIILFERPVRVGDVVTVDDITGVVSRIRIRATSITNWDRKEYVVPNKEFITGRLLNWTLTDKVNRVVVTIGIAYGSDTERAHELLLQVANDHPIVLGDPAPMATFESFGDNSLNFTLRAYLPGMDNRLQVIHDLHSEIDKAFRKARIEIAFPQRDLHIRSTSGLSLAALQPHSPESERQEAA